MINSFSCVYVTKFQHKFGRAWETCNVSSEKKIQRKTSHHRHLHQFLLTAPDNSTLLHLLTFPAFLHLPCALPTFNLFFLLSGRGEEFYSPIIIYLNYQERWAPYTGRLTQWRYKDWVNSRLEQFTGLMIQICEFSALGINSIDPLTLSVILTSKDAPLEGLPQKRANMTIEVVALHSLR